MDLVNKQKKLKLNLIDYNLDQKWFSHPLINSLRERMKLYLPEGGGLYDPQDLEHQVLFRLTTLDPKEITNEIIKNIVEEQYLIVQDRLKQTSFDLEYLFRGLSGKYHDLNCHDRLILRRNDNKITAGNKYHSFTVEFKIVEDEKLISLFTSELHYVHQDRPRGETFGFYFAGDKIPWAIETTEPAIICKQYKRDALLAHGIDPNKAIELTRFYVLPGSPLNAVSMIDSCVAKYYKQKGIEALFTSTMPMYSKTKGASIAGGINEVLLIKDLKHKFIPIEIEGKTCYRQVTNAYLENNNITDFITSNPNFPMLRTVELYMLISKPSLEPLEVLRDKTKVIYIKGREKKIEKELKFFVKDIASSLATIRQVAKFYRIEYLKDTIYGCGNKKKIRLRLVDDFNNVSVNAIYKYRIDSEDGTKTEVEETLYDSNNIDEALASIAQQGDFKKENSYEKVRVIYKNGKTEINLDIYPYGVWVEIEGDVDDIWGIANKLNYNKNDSITLNADELYLEWNKKVGLEELWHVRFGLPRDEEQEPNK